MTRKLKAFAFMVTMACAASALGASTASSAGLFTAEVGAGETAEIIGEQEGTNTLTINGLTLTCATETLKGKALTAGPSSTKITVEPTYVGCHVVLAGLTKLATVTVNGCAYVFDATSATTVEGSVECPAGKTIEIHIYSASTSEASTICTYHIGPQVFGADTVTTNFITHTIEIDTSSTFAAHNTVKSAVCGQETFLFIKKSGKHIIRAKKPSGPTVHLAAS